MALFVSLSESSSPREFELVRPLPIPLSGVLTPSSSFLFLQGRPYGSYSRPRLKAEATHIILGRDAYRLPDYVCFKARQPYSYRSCSSGGVARFMYRPSKRSTDVAYHELDPDKPAKLTYLQLSYNRRRGPQRSLPIPALGFDGGVPQIVTILSGKMADSKCVGLLRGHVPRITRVDSRSGKRLAEAMTVRRPRKPPWLLVCAEPPAMTRLPV